MKVSIEINCCDECPHRDHSGAFTANGAKPVCAHPKACDIRGKGKDDPWHWKHRKLRDPDKTIPGWCPLKAKP